MVILVAGANGFIGSHVAKVLQKEHTVFSLSSCGDSINPRHIQLRLPDHKLYDFLQNTAPDVFVNCTGSASVPLSLEKPWHDFSQSCVTVFQIYDAIRCMGGKTRVIQLSSAAVYGNPQQKFIAETCPLHPVSPYGWHKLYSEQIAVEFNELYNIPSTILRIFSCYGAGLKRQILWDVACKAIKGTVGLLGTGLETRDFINVNDLAAFVALLLQNNRPQGVEIINVASGEACAIADLARMLLKAMGLAHMDIQFSGATRLGDPVSWQADISKMLKEGFTPSISLMHGVAKYAEWFMNEHKSMPCRN